MACLRRVGAAEFEAQSLRGGALPAQEPGKQPTAEDGEKGAPPAEVDLGEYSSAEELEALGLERLKAELQRRGLKCGGSLRQRAERLYLLKTTPPEELDRSLFAKK
mmetsp:Transcript_2950/g.6924  ORF Transcript_2950/g.6924 Transcript_2950/m.6924 type:complete len:106 (-) Transcript_2950:131-448(-)